MHLCTSKYSDDGSCSLSLLTARDGRSHSDVSFRKLQIACSVIYPLWVMDLVAKVYWWRLSVANAQVGSKRGHYIFVFEWNNDVAKWQWTLTIIMKSSSPSHYNHHCCLSRKRMLTYIIKSTCLLFWTGSYIEGRCFACQLAIKIAKAFTGSFSGCASGVTTNLTKQSPYA